MHNKRNLLHIECIRIIAAFFVIFNHTGDDGFFLFSKYSRGGIHYWCYLFVSIFCKISVPLFFMIAGAMLLKKDIGFRKLWKEKILHMVLILFLFSGLHYLWSHIYFGDIRISVGDFLKELYIGNINFAYWYLYAYLSFLITIPFLRSLIKNLSNECYQYMICLNIIFVAIIPCCEYFIFHGIVYLNGYLRVGWLMTNIVMWPLVGYYCENIYDIKRISKKFLLFMIVMSIFGILVSCYMTFYKQGITGECSESVSQSFHSSFIILPCMTIYLGGKWLFEKVSMPRVVEKMILSMGGCTLGIYLLHVMIRDNKHITQLWRLFRNTLHMNYIVTAFIICFIILLIGYIITLSLKRIPGIRRLL